LYSEETDGQEFVLTASVHQHSDLFLLVKVHQSSHIVVTRPRIHLQVEQLQLLLTIEIGELQRFQQILRNVQHFQLGQPLKAADEQMTHMRLGQKEHLKRPTDQQRSVADRHEFVARQVDLLQSTVQLEYSIVHLFEPIAGQIDPVEPLHFGEGVQVNGVYVIFG
jgi:hypothetical protein